MNCLNYCENKNSCNTCYFQHFQQYILKVSFLVDLNFFSGARSSGFFSNKHFVLSIVVKQSDKIVSKTAIYPVKLSLRVSTFISGPTGDQLITNSKSPCFLLLLFVFIFDNRQMAGKYDWLKFESFVSDWLKYFTITI